MAKGKTGREDGRENDAVGDPGDKLGSRAKGRRDGVLSSQAVNGNGHNHVEADGDTLQPSEGKAEVANGVNHLGHVSDEVDVTRVSVADLETGVEAGTEVWVGDDQDLLVPVCGRSSGILGSERGHDEDGSGDDGDHAGDT